MIRKVFDKNLIGSLTSKDAVLKEVRDCIIRSDEEKLKDLKPYLQSYWHDLHVGIGCVCMDKKVAVTNAFKEALIKGLPASHPGSWGGPTLLVATHEQGLCAIECKAYTAISKNLKSIIPAMQFQPHKQ